jgi:hypothetical protein
MATATKDVKRAKSLPPPNSDFYARSSDTYFTRTGTRCNDFTDAAEHRASEHFLSGTIE